MLSTQQPRRSMWSPQRIPRPWGQSLLVQGSELIQCLGPPLPVIWLSASCGVLLRSQSNTLHVPDSSTYLKDFLLVDHLLAYAWVPLRTTFTCACECSEIPFPSWCMSLKFKSHLLELQLSLLLQQFGPPAYSSVQLNKPPLILKCFPSSHLNPLFLSVAFIPEPLLAVTSEESRLRGRLPPSGSRPLDPENR